MQSYRELLNSILTSSTANFQGETTRWGGGWFTAFNSANRVSVIRVKKAKMSSSTSSDLLGQLKAVIQCASVSFFLLELETHFMFFQSRCLLEGLGRVGLFSHNVSLSPAKNISLKCEHLKSNACRTVVSIIWLSGADHFTHTAQRPINKIACREAHCPVCWPKKRTFTGWLGLLYLKRRSLPSTHIDCFLLLWQIGGSQYTSTLMSGVHLATGLLGLSIREQECSQGFHL